MQDCAKNHKHQKEQQQQQKKQKNKQKKQTTTTTTTNNKKVSKCRLWKREGWICAATDWHYACVTIRPPHQEYPSPFCKS